MMLLQGKKILVTGVLTETSIAASVARLAIDEGADVLLTSFGRAMRLTERMARRMPGSPPVVEFDAGDPDAPATLSEEIAGQWGALDGAVHAIGFAPDACLGGDFMRAAWDDVAVAMHVSAYSLKALAEACLPHMGGGGSIVALDFDARVAWPSYDWMGVAKAALESTARYLARDLGGDGVRVNLVSAGPLRTTAARGVPGFDGLADGWGERAPLGWDTKNPDPVARACAVLLSDWFPATTGELVHVDGGYHAMGA